MPLRLVSRVLFRQAKLVKNAAPSGLRWTRGQKLPASNGVGVLQTLDILEVSMPQRQSRR
jgi:hypothetical protein